MKLVKHFKKKFFNKAFAIYFGVGIFFTILSSIGATVAGVFLHESPQMLFWTNFLLVNGVLFIIKYLTFLKFGFVSEKNQKRKILV